MIHRTVDNYSEAECLRMTRSHDAGLAGVLSLGRARAIPMTLNANPGLSVLIRDQYEIYNDHVHLL